MSLLDHNTIPFSRYGSFLAISRLARQEGLFLRTVRGGDFGSDGGVIFEITPTTAQGERLDFVVSMQPAELTLTTAQGTIRFCFAEPNLLAVYGEEVNLTLQRQSGRYDNVFALAPQILRVNCARPDLRYTVSALVGTVGFNAPWRDDRSTGIDITLQPGSKGYFHVALQEFTGASDAPQIILERLKDVPSYRVQVKNVAKLYEQWKETILPVPSRYQQGREMAAYITWSCVVAPSGVLTRPAMYMSKNWMTNIWSWDNCFNALALAKNNPTLAWDQLMIFFDLQDNSGMLADFINDKFAYYAFTKPPIQGWALSLLLEENPGFFESRLHEIFPALELVTNYWFDYTDYSGEGMPNYNHGNDAGWDNSTIFAGGLPVASPDLLAFLIVQMDVLAQVANRLGLFEKARYWQERADSSLHLLLMRYWNGQEFVVPGKTKVGDSLIAYMPLLLGKRLPQEIMTKLVQDVKEEGRFFTPHGLATESVRSSFYREDGYWRGPIWAPSTMLMVDALRRCGEHEFAREVAQRYVRMANDSGMAENFNAITGEGLRDPAFTWTSSVFLYLASRLEENDAP